MSFCVIKENPNLCTGCEACVQSCQFSAISMVRDKEGFLYPEINSDFCTECGKCGIVCPECGQQSFKREPLPENCLAATHKDNSVLLNSSSGGAFSAIVSVADKGSIVYGAAYNDDLFVYHYATRNDLEFKKLLKSKYVQSHIGNSYVEAKKYLQAGQSVVFSGTPCQIAGLRNYLGRSYDRLTCIEIICHGVGSPGVFANYIKEYEKKAGRKIVGFTFRSKKRFLGSWKDFLTTIKFENGKSYSTRFDLYTNGFLNGLFLRKCCINCNYASDKRVSDIVIGDFWGIEKKHPNILCKDGVSVIFPVTEKGLNYCNRLSTLMLVKVVPTVDAIHGNSVLLHPKKYIEGRDDFFKAYSERGIYKALLLYVKTPGFLYRLISYMPEDIKDVLRKLRKEVFNDSKR